jgi:hypothetical protein
MGLKNVRAPQRWAAALAAAMVLTACNETDPLYEIARDTPIFYNPVTQEGTGLPRGDVDIQQYNLIEFNTSVPDAFGRTTTTANGLFGHAVGTSSGNYWAVGLHGSTADPRLPAPTVSGSGGAVYIAGTDAWMPDGEFNVWLPAIGGIGTPGTQYALALVRYGVDVNGTLDTEQRLFGDPITQPDQLVLLPNNPGGAFVEGNNYGEACRDVAAAQLTANPLVLGLTTATAGGIPEMDLSICSGNWYSTGTAITQTGITPIAPNKTAFFNLPQYNYVALFPLDGGGNLILNQPLMRRQLAPDIDAANPTQIRNNAMAPFPTAAMTQAALLAAPGGIGAPSTIRMRVYNLDTHGDREYHGWLYNTHTGLWNPTVGNILIEEEIVTVTDAGDVVITYDTVYEATAATTFPGMPGLGTYRFTYTVRDADLETGTIIGQHTHFVLGVESGAVSTPSAGVPMPVWRQFTDQSGTPEQYADDRFIPGPVRFGTFVPGGASYVYAVTGSGRANYFGDELRITITDLARPPVGYYYHGWLVNENTGEYVSLGELTTPPPEPFTLRDADVNEGVHGVTRTAVVGAALSVSEAMFTGQFWDFTSLRITLESKTEGPATIAPNVIYQSPVPDVILQSRPTPGS